MECFANSGTVVTKSVRFGKVLIYELPWGVSRSITADIITPSTLPLNTEASDLTRLDVRILPRQRTVFAMGWVGNIIRIISLSTAASQIRCAKYLSCLNIKDKQESRLHSRVLSQQCLLWGPSMFWWRSPLLSLWFTCENILMGRLTLVCHTHLAPEVSP